jgi:hypothetical protein
MRFLTRVLAAAVLLALVVAGTALAARGDPQRQIRAADEARARAMLLVRTDLPPGFKKAPPEPESEDPYCKALDESDLTLTGDAEQPGFRKSVFFVASASQVYRTTSDANTSWRRGTSPAGVRCARTQIAAEITGDGGTFRSFRRIAFPRVASRTAAFRVEARREQIPVILDFVAMQHARAHVSVVFISALAPVPKPEQVRIARVLAGRAVKAMRGA